METYTTHTRVFKKNKETIIKVPLLNIDHYYETLVNQEHYDKDYFYKDLFSYLVIDKINCTLELTDSILKKTGDKINLDLSLEYRVKSLTSEIKWYKLRTAINWIFKWVKVNWLEYKNQKHISKYTAQTFFSAFWMLNIQEKLEETGNTWKIEEIIELIKNKEHINPQKKANLIHALSLISNYWLDKTWSIKVSNYWEHWISWFLRKYWEQVIQIVESKNKIYEEWKSKWIIITEEMQKILDELNISNESWNLEKQ